jgi:hypothetical protein
MLCVHPQIAACAVVAQADKKHRNKCLQQQQHLLPSLFVNAPHTVITMPYPHSRCSLQDSDITCYFACQSYCCAQINVTIPMPVPTPV